MQTPRYFRHGAVALLLAGFALNATAATVTALPSTPSNIITSGFESPAIAAEPGGFVYTPAGTNWTFTGRTGIAANGSFFNNANAPQGGQVGILQRPQPGVPGPSTMTRSFTIASAGRYRLSLQSAQRLTQQQIASVKIDGNEIGQFKPAGATFEPVVFDALMLGSGNHDLSFTALVIAGDNTLFIDDVRIDSIAGEARAWSNPATWNTGVVPTAADDVVIPAGSSVLMDGALLAKSISVSGNLYCADSNITLETQWLAVMGRLVCGSSGSRYTNNFMLTLTGADDGGDIMGMGDKFLGAMGRGAIELHGEQRASFVQLGATAEIGSSVIALSGVVDWRTGDELVIAPTRWIAVGQIESEVVAVHSVTQNGPLNGRYSVVQLKTPLTKRHFGKTSQYSKPDNSYSWTLDERAEVGLLTRNIRIQGDQASATAGFGGHMMTMRGSSVHANGIELRRMGQKAKLARYPFHWHLARDVPGQYIQNSSIHESYNRCVVVHGTHQARVADNVCYNFIGHGYFLENGNEKNNTFDHNLAVWARKPQGPAATPPNLPLATDLRTGIASNGPAAFWISHPDNIVTNNVAAGTEGSAFWYHLETEAFVPPPEPGCDATPIEPGCTRPLPDALPPTTSIFGTFDNNRAYASVQGFSSCFEEGAFGMSSPNALIRRLTTSSVAQGIWPCGFANTVFEQAIVANTENGMQSPTPVTFRDSLFVAYTENEPARAAPMQEIPWAGIFMYDQGFTLDNVHFQDYNRVTMSAFQVLGGAAKMTNRSSRLSFSAGSNKFKDISDAWRMGGSPVSWGDVIHDLDGSFVGLGAGGVPRAMVSSHPLMTDRYCSRAAGDGFDGYGCPYRYGLFRIDGVRLESEDVLSGAPRVTTIRSDGVNDSFEHWPFSFRFMHQFMSNGPYSHSYRYLDGPRHRSAVIGTYLSDPGNSSIHQLLDVDDDFYVFASYLASSCGVAPPDCWTPVSSLALLTSSTVPAFFHDTTSASVYFKMVAANVAGEVHSQAVVCLYPLPDGSCPTGRLNVARPTVRFAAPLDGERVAPGPLTFKADLADASSGIDKVRLFIGDELKVEQDILGQPASVSVSLPTSLSVGSYAVKLVVWNNDGDTYTAVQRLIVGDPAPAIVIDGFAEINTYRLGSAPALTFQRINPPSGSHVRVLHNGMDQGVVSGSSVSLSALSRGRHDFVITYAAADGSVLAIDDRRTIYIVDAAVDPVVANADRLADFEQGLDLRASLWPYGANRPYTYGYYSFYSGLFATGYLDGVADIVYLDIPRAPSGTSGAQAVFRMELNPPQNWTDYATVNILHAGPGFELFLLRANAAPKRLGIANPTGLFTTAFPLVAGEKTQVIGLELRQTQLPPSSPSTYERQHLHHIDLVR